MKKILSIAIGIMLTFSVLHAEKLKITNDEVLSVKISNSQPTVVNFNFFIKKIKKIFNQKNKTQVKLLDKGIVIIPDSKKTSGIIIITNEQGTSYTISFKADKDGDSIIKINDITYSKNKVEKLNLETQNVDKDVSAIIKKLDNMDPKHLKLPGFDLEQSSFTIKSKDGSFSMTRIYRWTGKKYIVDSWIIKNLTNEPLVFKHRDFATKGVIAASVQPKVVYPDGIASLYLITDRATLSKMIKE